MYSIIPTPSVFYEIEDTFYLSSTVIISAESEYAGLAKAFLEYIRPCYTAFSGYVDFTDNMQSTFHIVCNSSLAKEEYTLNIDADGIVIEIGSNIAGIHALNTFKQILPAYAHRNNEVIALDCCYISDKPRYYWRGFMLDCARNFFAVEDILSLLDELSMLKINKFHWHLSDNQGYRIESTKFPNLNKIGSVRNDTQIGGASSKNYKGIEYSGYYTKKDISIIVNHASKLNIEVIPEVNIINHCTAILASYPTLNKESEKISVSTNFNNNTHCIDFNQKQNVEMVKEMLTEIAELFPSNHFHIGGKHFDFSLMTNFDSYYQIDKNSCIDYVNEIAMHLLSLGKKTIAYDCLLDKNLLDNVIIQLTSTANNPHIFDEIKKGRLFILSKEKYSNFELPYAKLPLSKVYNYRPNIDDIENTVTAFNTNILGIESYLNTCWIYDANMMQFCVFPRICAMAERAWSEESFVNYDNFLQRLVFYNKYLKNNRIVYAKRKIFNKHSIYKSMRYCHLWRSKDPYCEFRFNQTLTEDNNDY